MLGSTTLRVARSPLATSALSARAFSSTARASVARMSIVGRLAAPPEDMNAGEDRSLVRFALGTDSGRGENKKTSWFKVVTFTQGPQKDFLLGLPKGALLYVDADARMDSYDDKDGNRRTSLGLLATKFDVLSRPRPTEEVGHGDEGLVEGRA